MAEEPEPSGPAGAVTAEQLMEPFLGGHSDDVEVLRDLAAIAIDIARNVSDSDRMFEAFHRVGTAIDRFRAEEAFAAAATGGYVSQPGVPDVSRDQVIDELRQDAEYDRFRFFVAAAAANPERFGEYLRGTDDERTARILREAATRAEELNRPSREEILTAVYDAVIADIPPEWRSRVTNAFRSARGEWHAYGGLDLVRRLSAMERFGDEFPSSSRPLGAKPLTGVRIAELYRDAMNTPDWQKTERALAYRERSANGAVRRFYVEALAANADTVREHLPADVLPQLPELEREARGVRRRANEGHRLTPPPTAATEPEPATRALTESEAIFAEAATRGRNLLGLAIEGADRLRASGPELTAVDRETLTILARLAAAVDGEASPRHREQVQAWYGQFGSTLAASHQHESARSAEAPTPQFERLRAELADDVERARRKFLAAAAAADPDAFRALAIKIPPHIVDRATLSISLDAGRAIRAREETALDRVLEQVHDAAIDSLDPDDDLRRDRVTAAYRTTLGVLRKARAVALDEPVALARALLEAESSPDNASPWTLERTGHVMSRAMASPAGRKLARGAAHHQRGAIAQFHSFLAEALAAAPEATLAQLPLEFQSAVPELEPRVRQIRRKTAESASPPGKSSRARRRRG